MKPSRIPAGIIILCAVITATIYLNGTPFSSGHLSPYNGSYGYAYHPLAPLNQPKAIASCTAQGQTSYNCENNLCIPVNGGSGEYQSIVDCSTKCENNNQCDVLSVQASCTPNSIAPNATSTCTATVDTSGENCNTGVTWSVDLGTINGNGLYTASQGVGTANVTAVSNQDGTTSGNAQILVENNPPPPPATSTLTVNLTDNGGSAQYADFILSITDNGLLRCGGAAKQTQTCDLNQGDPYVVSEATTTASEDYTVSLGSTCSGTVGKNPITCAIVNTYVPGQGTPPNAPTGLETEPVSQNGILVAWQPSSDPSGQVEGYYLYRAGVKIANVSSTSYIDNSLSEATTYNYSVAAYDTHDNISAPSNPAQGTTLGDTILASQFGAVVNRQEDNNDPANIILPMGTGRIWDDGAQWQNWEPTQQNSINSSGWDWTGLDTILQTDKSIGINSVLFTVMRVPDWAATTTDQYDNGQPVQCNYNTDGDTRNCYPMKDINPDGTGSDMIWRIMIAAVATHIANLNPAVYAHVKYWGFWDEIYRSTTLSPGANWPLQMSWEGTNAQMLRAYQDASCIITGRTTEITATGETCQQVLQSVGLTAPVDPLEMIGGPAGAVAPNLGIYAFGTTANFLYCNNNGTNGYGSCDTYNAQAQADESMGDLGAQVSDYLNYEQYYGTPFQSLETEISTAMSQIKATLQPAEQQKFEISSEGGYNIPKSIFQNDDEQRSFVGRYYLLMASNNMTPAIWYSYDENPGGSGLYNPQNGQLVPGGAAWQIVNSWMVGSQLTQPCLNTKGNIWTCGLTLQNGTQAEAVWDATANFCRSSTSTGCAVTATMAVPSGFNEYEDLFSTSTHPIQGNTLSLTLSPILIEKGSGNPAQGIPQSFFSANDFAGDGAPQVSYGVLGHGQFVWLTAERCNGGPDPTNPCYNWTDFDQLVGEAPKNSQGVSQIILNLAQTPGWAVTNTSTCTTNFGLTGCTAPPANVQYWTDFITALTTHYNGTTEPYVQYYELWNEVNGNYWTGTIPQMVALAQAAYPIIHANSPESLVITPSTVAPTGAQWLSTYLADGGTQYTDIASFHGYVGNTNPPEVVDQIAQSYTPVLQQYGIKELFDTEGSWGCNKPGNGNYLSDPDQEIAWLGRWMLIQTGLYSSNPLDLVSWFTWGDTTSTPNTCGPIESSSGGPNANGVAWNQVYNWTVGATTQPCTQNGTIWSCAITRSGGYEAYATWDTSQTCSNGVCTTQDQSVPGGYNYYRDLAGDPPISISGGEVPVGLKPILVENQGQ